MAFWKALRNIERRWEALGGNRKAFGRHRKACRSMEKYWEGVWKTLDIDRH